MKLIRSSFILHACVVVVSTSHLVIDSLVSLQHLPGSGVRPVLVLF